MLLQGIFNKFGALFMIIPEPIVGGIFCVMFGLTATSGTIYGPFKITLDAEEATLY